MKITNIFIHKILKNQIKFRILIYQKFIFLINMNINKKFKEFKNKII